MRELPTGTVTLLFTDIEGSTRLLQQAGERYANVLEECRTLLRTAFLESHGHEVDTQGDAFFVAFARATDAVAAAVAGQRALFTHAWPEAMAVRVRMGLHTGEPHQSAEGYVGLDVHHTARIMNAGHGNQILLSQTTRDLVEHALPKGASLRDLGTHRLKDLEHPHHLYQLVCEGLPADFPPLKTLDTRPHNLAIQLTPLIGREQEVAVVQHLLQRQEVRLLTLTGPGGTGKTRLGLQVAAELSELFADGVYFVNLAPIGDPEFVVSTIAQTLAVKEIADQLLLDLVSAFLREKQLLLLLDNFEQVVGAAVQVAALLAACPKIKMIVTSRAALHIRGEQEFAVPPLAVPDQKRLTDLVALSQNEAVALFILRAQAIKPDFQMTDGNAPAIAEICVRLDGLPLAIELAASRIKVLPPQALLARLGQRLTVLSSGARDVPMRQQTLRNTIEWSYNLLDAQEQRLFQRLSIFGGGCTLEAVEVVCATLDNNSAAGQALDGVASLVDKSLLQQTERDNNEPRFVMLETIREYGLAVLATSGQMEMALQAHANYYLRLTEEAEPEFGGSQQAVWLERLEREHDNLRAALEWLLKQGKAGENVEMALRLAGALEWFWKVRGYFREGRTFLERALAACEGAAAPIRAKALNATANLAYRQGDLDRAEVLAQESLAVRRELGDTRGIAGILGLLGMLAISRGNSAAARSQLEESALLFKEVGDKQDIADSLFNLGELDSHQGEYIRACTLLEESLVLYRELGHKRNIAATIIRLAYALFYSQGDQTTVSSLLEESLLLHREVSDKTGIALCLLLSGEGALLQCDTVTAHALAEESLELCREAGDRFGIADALSLLGKVAAVQGDDVAARAFFEESLVIARAIGNRPSSAFLLEGLAGVATAQGKFLWAVRLWGSAEGLRKTLSMPVPPIYRADYERLVVFARTQLGGRSFAAAWAEGRMMTPEQALAAETRVMKPSSGEPSSAPPAKSPLTYPDGLTAREVEVLGLVARGLTNEQVAEQLVISPRTVNTRLTSIYGKIGVSSRSAATRYAIEHHLI
jgi:predicted ATPase/class 3 adenylate cyclase/DNA-binding CsgD family transcriptional regulator